MATDVKNDASLSTSLVAYYELEEASGDRIDSHGAYDMTDVNTVAQGTGIQGNCGDFEQANSEYLTRSSDNTVFDGVTSFSISAWVYIESFTATYPTVASVWNDGTTNRAWALAFVSQQPYFYISQSGDNATLQNVTSGATLSTGAWHHLVGTFNGGTGNVRIYVNNTQYTTASARTGIFNSSAPFRIGHADRFASLTNGYFDGLIDEVGIWTKELTSTEVSDLYNSGAGIPYDAGGGGGSPTPTLMMMGVGS